MIVVTMAQHHSIDAPDALDIRHTAWLGPLPAVRRSLRDPASTTKAAGSFGPSPETA